MSDKPTNNNNKSKLSEIKINQDEELSKKYFYISKNSNLSQMRKKNIFQLLEKQRLGENLNFFQDVDKINIKTKKKRDQLEKTKENCLQNIILSNKQIPEKWIMLPDYRNLLNKAMQNEKVLNYSIQNKDLYAKRSGNYGTDDERYEKYMNEIKNTPIKKFIGYINPNKKYIAESPIKNKIRKNYCLSLNYKKRRKIKCNVSEDMEKPLNQMIELSPVKDLIENLENSKNSNDEKLPDILEHKKKRKNKDEIIVNNTISNNEDIRNDFMLTSLYYRGTDNEDDENKKDKKTIELPKII